MKITRVTTFTLMIASVGNASQSLQSGSGVSANLPSGAPWSTVTNWRTEIRLDGWASNGSYQDILGTNSFAVRLVSTNVMLTSWRDNSASCSVNLAGIADAIVRVQRDAANSRLTVEAWSAVDGSGYLQAVCYTPTPGVPDEAGSTVSVGGLNGSLAYARVYSTLVPLATAPSNNWNGNLLDYELEGDGRDLSQSGMNLSMSTAVYHDTPQYSPHAAFGQTGQPQTFRASTGFLTLDASQSFSSTDNATLQHSWQQLSGPSTGHFTNASSALTDFYAAIAGSYQIQDTVCDSLGLCGSAVMNMGGVATDPSGFVITGNPSLDFVLGPLTISGSSPWPWYDVAEGADADILAPYQTTLPSSVPLTGTATVTAADAFAPPMLTGTGTHFLSETATGNVIFLNWPTPDGLLGVYMGTISSISDDTHMTLYGTTYPVPLPLINVTMATSTDVNGWGSWGLAGSRLTDWNFYDDALALYRHYYRTGLSEYLKQARTLADNWYHYALDHGYSLQYPRVASLQGIIARALDGKPEYWAGILAYMNTPIGWQSQFKQTTPLPLGSTIDPREFGYMLRWGSLIAELHPDPAVRAEWCGNVSNAVTNVWPVVQNSLGNFEEDVYNQNPGYPYAPAQGKYGSSPWRATIGLLGLHKAYEVLYDPAACNNSTLAAKTLNVIEKFTHFAHDYGKGGNRGQLYSVNFQSIGQDPLAYKGYNKNTPNTGGTLAVTPGSTIVTGSDTRFTTVFWHAPCAVSQPWCIDGQVQGQPASYNGTSLTIPTNFIGIPANCVRLTFQVESVQSDTQLTLASPWPSGCPAESGVGTNRNAGSNGWAATWLGNTSCGQYSLAAYCEGGPTGDRNLTHDIHEAYMWLFQMTGSINYYYWAQDSLGADYGGSVGGPGSSLPFAGPLSDGNTGFMHDPTQPCSITSPPCGGNGPTNNQGKAFGQSVGAGNAPNAIARYLGSVAPIIRNPVYIDFDSSAISGSSKVRIVVTAPSGTSSSFACSASPCAVSYDARQGKSQAVIQYLSQGGNLLSVSESFQVQ